MKEDEMEWTDVSHENFAELFPGLPEGFRRSTLSDLTKFHRGTYSSRAEAREHLDERQKVVRIRWVGVRSDGLIRAYTGDYVGDSRTVTHMWPTYNGGNERVVTMTPGKRRRDTYKVRLSSDQGITEEKMAFDIETHVAEAVATSIQLVMGN